VTLFYLYTPVSLPLEPVVEWQRALCTRLGLLGRARIAEEGINATFAGSKEAIDAYVEAMRTEGPPAPHPDSTRSPPLFARTAFKFSLSDTLPFAGLGMFIVPELTASGKMGKSKPPGLQEQLPSQAGVAAAAAASGVDGAPPAAERSSSLHLTPAEFHDALSNFDPETTLLLDTRNAYETAVGTFEHAVDPKLRAFHQLPEFISQNLPAIRSKKKVLMFCTGGVRCEKASLYLAHRAGPDTQVLQLEGGIHKYLDAFPDGGHFKGKNFVFDARLAMAPSEHAPNGNNANGSAGSAEAAKDAVVGHCVHCGVTDDFLSEAISCAVCKSFVILCAGCRTLYADKKWNYFCTEHMLLTAAEGAPEIEHMKGKQAHNKRQKRGEQQQEQTVEGDAAAASPSPSPSPSPSASPDSAASASPAAASASPSPAAAAMSDDSVTAASSGDDAAAAAATGVAASPSPSLSCLEQWHSFLRRFTLVQLEAQLAEIDAILAYFASPAQRKAKSRSANRKQNLHVQRKRLAAYILERRAAAAADPNSSDAGAAAAASAAEGESKEQKPVVSTVAPPQFLSFVPFLNV
jgi:predicted sulfurtransferase